MNKHFLSIVAITIFFLGSLAAQEGTADVDPSTGSSSVKTDASPMSDASRSSQVKEPSAEETPWDFDPYRVLVWYVSDDSSVAFADLEVPLRAYLDRDFSAVWRVDFASAPKSVATAAKRGISDLTYDKIVSADPVLAVKRDHPDAVRIRVARNIGDYVTKVYTTADRGQEVLARAAAIENKDFDGIAKKLELLSGDEFTVRDLWAQSVATESETKEESESESESDDTASKKKEVEAILVSRGIANTLVPEAKLVVPKISELVGQIVEDYDKVFIVSVTQSEVPIKVQVVEFDTLMRHFGPVATVNALNVNLLPRAMSIAITKAFGPVVRIENAGLRSALGLVRAGGLVREKDREHSPAWIRVGDVLEPMTRKNDRNGNPIMVGPLDWAYLNVTELDGYQDRNVKMDFYSGRGGGLQGRKNKRTFRTALKVRPQLGATEVRLHLERDEDFPLIGYELYQKNLETGDMTFVGRTNWNGLLNVEQTDDPMRLLYVKNGGAILARLPVVPGLYANAVADLSGDDIRLQAEAYIRGAQNSIIDLVAIRELFKARILMRLERGEMEKAEELLTALRDEPTSDVLYGAIGKKQQDFINLLGSNNANQSRKVDEMFSTTRELLQKHVTPKLVQDLELSFIEAQKNGGKLPPREKKPKVDNSADAKEENDTESANGSK